MHSWTFFQIPSAVSVYVCLQFGEALGTEDCAGYAPLQKAASLSGYNREQIGKHLNCNYTCTKERCKIEDIYLKKSWRHRSLRLRKNNFFFFPRPGLFICQVQPDFSSWGFNGWRLIQNGNIDRLSNNSLIIFIPCPYMHFFPEGSSDFSCLQ